MKFSIREKIFAIGLVLSLIIFLTINAVSYWNTKRHIESRENVEKALVIIYECENLISMIKDAETGQRGFIITGNWTFLEPYYNGVTTVHRSMKILKDLTTIDAQAYQKLNAIQEMIEERFAQFHKTISLRKKGEIADARESFMTAENEKIMYDIRNMVEELKHEKTDLLQNLNKISKARSDNTLFTILIGNLVALLFVSLSLFQLYRDITERKRMEEALKESENKFRSFAENALVGIYLIQDEVLKYVNPKFAEIFNYTVEECLNNMHIRQIIHPEDFETVQKNIHRASGEIQSVHYAIRGIKKTGEIIYCELYGSSIMFDGRFTATGTILEITDRKRAEEQLKESRQLLRSLVGRLEKVREEERVIISREIHDIMGGGLTGLKMDLSWLMRKVKNAESDKEQAAITSRIIASSDSIDQMIKVTRRISTELRPPVLDDLGLIAALEWQLSDFTSRTGILNKFNTVFEYAVLESAQIVAVFRIFQEALTNIARHSMATKVMVVLREDGRSPSGDENLVLEISDNGRGILEEEILSSKALGLLGMKERAMAFGGEFSIFGEPGEGTTVIIKIPRNPGGANDQSYNS